MKKKSVFACLSVFVLMGGLSYANLLVKMTAEKTTLLQNEETTVTLHAWANFASATGQNGLNAWQLDVSVNLGGVVQVTGVQLLAPTPWSAADSGYTSLNSPLSGQIKYLHLVTQSLPQNSTVGVGGYTPIASFNIKAIGQAGQSVAYSIPTGDDFLGILADGTTILNGVFDSANSQTVFTIVPEPSSLLILSGLAVVGMFRRSRK